MLEFETPERNKGQIVTYSYATTASGATIEERHDASDGTLTYRWVNPEIGYVIGRKLTSKQLARYKLVQDYQE